MSFSLRIEDCRKTVIEGFYERGGATSLNYI